MLLKPPVFHLQDNRGCFQLYSDTSHTATGGALYQIQTNPCFLHYASKQLHSV